MLASNPTTRC